MYRELKYGCNYIWNNQLLALSERTGKCLVKPCQIYVLWTGICNFSCPMCKVREWKEKLSFDVVIDLIDQLSEWGVPKFTIAGGEPLLFRDEFLRILAHANRKGLLTHFSTNGTNCDGDLLEEYSRIGGGQVTVSLDGSTKKTHDRMRNYEGAFEIATNAIETYKNLRPRNVTLKVQPVLTNENLNEIVGVFEIARDSNALFSIQAYDPMDFAVLKKEVPLEEIRKKHPLWVSEENFPLLEETIESILRLRKTYPGIVLNTPEHLRDMILYFERRLNFTGRCLVGYTSLFILPDGHSTMCLYGDIGSIKEKPIRELWHSDRLDRIRKQMLECDRPCLNGCAQRYTTGKILYEGYRYLKRRFQG